MLDLEPIKARVAAATPGTWCADIYDDGTQARVLVLGGIYPHVAYLNDGTNATLMDNGPANAEFIAAARDDVPALVAELELTRRALLYAVKDLDAWSDVGKAVQNYLDIASQSPIT